VIVIPDVFRNYNCLGIDPGLGACGFSAFGVEEFRVAWINAFTVFSEKVAMDSELDEEVHSDRAIRLDRLRQAYLQILHVFNPIAVTCEAPFFNRRFPGAYGPLVEVVSMLRQATYEFNSNIPFIVYAPMTVKQSFKTTKDTSKEAMLQALSQNYPQIVSKLVVPLELMDQHAIDATAVCYTLLSKYF
jgi:Holliday junction resolvasome RuvABC endonuclease subunit